LGFLILPWSGTFYCDIMIVWEEYYV